MNKDEIIAEWCEPKPKTPPPCTGVWTGKFWYWMPGIGWLPRHYSESRDVMDNAEKVVEERGLRLEYFDALLSIIVPDPGDKFGFWELQECMFDVATATAPQRAEALCRVIEAEQ